MDATADVRGEVPRQPGVQRPYGPGEAARVGPGGPALGWVSAWQPSEDGDSIPPEPASWLRCWGDPAQPERVWYVGEDLHQPVHLDDLPDLEAFVAVRKQLLVDWLRSGQVDPQASGGQELSALSAYCLGALSTWMQGHEVRESDLFRADLSQADLRGANLDYVRMQRVDFRGANLRGASLRHTDSHGAQWDDADLREVHWDYSSSDALATRKGRRW